MPRRDETERAHAAARALREMIPTRRHAELLLDLVLDHLGEGAWAESVGGGDVRMIFRREAPGSEWVVPWPLLTVIRGGPEGPGPVLDIATGEVKEPAPPPRPGPKPRLRDLGSGRLRVHDGPHLLEVGYGGDGRWYETRIHHEAGALGAILELDGESGAPAERIARLVADLDAGRHGPARARLPVPLPKSVTSIWGAAALPAMRGAVFRDPPPGARWVCADGWTGEALAWGATRDEAVEAWREELARIRPFPEKPKPRRPDDDEPSQVHSFTTEDGGFGVIFDIRGGATSDVPWVEPTVESSPCVAVELPDLPDRPPPLGEWVRLLDAHGATVPAAMRWEPEGFTLLGDRLAERRDLDWVEEQIGIADASFVPMRKPKTPPELVTKYRLDERPERHTEIRFYRLLEEGTGADVKPSIPLSGPVARFEARMLDPEHVRWGVARLRPILG